MPEATADVVDGQAEELDETNAPDAEADPVTEPGAGLERHHRPMDVMKPLDGDQLVASFAAYQQLRGRLLTPDDYQSAGGDRKFVKKSGWRKIATAFGLDVEIRKSAVERDDQGNPLRASVVARAIAPNGRFSDGDGYCDVAEDRFSGPRGNKAKLENDLRATATTRAKNRAISDLVGMGEVSAEEVSDTDTATSAGPGFDRATEEQRKAATQALGGIVGDPEKARDIYVEALSHFGDVCPTGLAVLLVNLGEHLATPAETEGKSA